MAEGESEEERQLRQEAVVQLGIPASACISLELLEELGKSSNGDDPRLLDLVRAFYEELDGRRESGELTHADLMASKRISQLMDCKAYNEGRVTAAELSAKNSIFANVDLSEITLGESGRASDLWPEDTDE